MTRAERIAALRSFAQGAVRILLATDAASEGLNLHHTCRVVVNLELPWNPMRLEQRIGRVDRIGQTRTVHACHLVGSDSGELRLVDDLRVRIARARADIGAPDPLDGALDDANAETVGSDHADVESELKRVRLQRALPATRAAIDRPLLAAARNRHTRARLQRRSLSLWECALEDGRHRVVESCLVPMLDAPPDSDAMVLGAAAAWQSSAMRAARAFAAAGLARSEAIATALERDDVATLQPGLFDRRAHVAHAALRAAQAEAVGAQTIRTAELRLSAEVSVCPPHLRLVLVPRS
jgi:superfamily II DNA/RNA helicase